MENKINKMGSDIIAEIKRGRKVGYSDNLIKRSLELEGYSSGSITQAFKEIDKNCNGNGVSFVIKTKSIKRPENNFIAEKNKALVEKKPLPVILKPKDMLPAEKEAPGALVEKNMPSPSSAKDSKKHWVKVCVEILIGIMVFGVIGVFLYLFMMPAILSA
ncbi:MAG: hypothetical protein KJ922_03200 [Nanoarchaeota archaeon]|nr:hypothetical protein [Nanoarchaeota archaeon]MBU1704346.1 hypothetical protein [Nanoarchaeota archaeon]